jgi:hypothetical protein
MVEVIVHFREKCTFKRNIPKRQMFWYKDLQTVQQDGLYSIYNISRYLGKYMQNEKQMVAIIHAVVKRFTSREKGQAIYFTWIISSQLHIYLMTCTQELSTIVEM